MGQKLKVGFAAVAVSIFCVLAYLHAQPMPQSSADALEAYFAKIEAKIDKLSRNADNVQITQKLDQIINTQQQILKELEVVKVRATQR